MTIILIDCRHVGHELQRARASAGLSGKQAADLLGVSRRELNKYEHGKATMPDGMLHRMMHFGYLILRARAASQLRNAKNNYK